MAHRFFSPFVRTALVVAAAIALAGCQASEVPKHLKPVPPALQAKMNELEMRANAPIFIRIFKEESQLEVWKQRRDGRFALLKTYEICAWSGALGPKVREGDRQAPEGFYTVTPAQMNPNSNYYLSFNIGYPNAYDRSLGRTGAHLMVHGACSSAGCYSMTDESAGEIFAMARDAFGGGQRAFQIQAMPFRMTAENMARHRDDPNMSFWRMLKVGYDHFEVTKVPPKVDVCNRGYVFDADAGTAVFSPSEACPAYEVPAPIEQAVAAKESRDAQLYQVAVARLERGGDSNATLFAWTQPSERTRAGVPTPVALPAADRGTTVAAVAAPAGAVEQPAEERRNLFGRLFHREPAAAAVAEAPRQAPAVTAAVVPTPRPSPIARTAGLMPSRNLAAAGEMRAPQPTDRVFANAAFAGRVEDAFGALIGGSAGLLPSTMSAYAEERSR